MQRPLIAAIAIAFLCAAAPAVSEDVVSQDVVSQDNGSPALECEVNGYDLIIRNGGEETFPKGQSIDWEVRFSRSAGVHVLEEDVEPGGRVYLTGALGASYLNSGTPCTVAFSELPDE